jgi:hypothetical protein
MREENSMSPNVICDIQYHPVWEMKYRYHIFKGEIAIFGVGDWFIIPLKREMRIPAKTATYSGNNFTTYTLIQFPC